MMINAESIDPREVLTHLHALGYKDISPHQLKEFIHDLKKLIKYEQTHCDDNTTSFSSRTSDCECSYTEYGDSYKSSSNESCVSSVESPIQDDQPKSGKLDEIPHKTRLQLDYESSQKFQASYIKPWNLRIGKEASNKGRKHFDPVRLYHHYKELWTRQRVPGENKHSQLCWFVRNKMMGQEPSPRMLTGSNRGFMS